MSCGGWWISSSGLIEIGDRCIVLLLKIPCGLLRLQRRPTYKISSEILVIPLEKAQNKQREGCSLVCISGVSDIPSQRRSQMSEPQVPETASLINSCTIPTS